MTLSLINVYLIILVVLFIIAIAGISFAIVRSRKAGKNASTITPPIPDASHRNEQTRVDQDSSQVTARPDPDEDLSATRNRPEL